MYLNAAQMSHFQLEVLGCHEVMEELNDFWIQHSCKALTVIFFMIHEVDV